MPATLCMDTWVKLSTAFLEKVGDGKLTARQYNVTAELVSRYTKCMRLYDNAVAQSVTEKVTPS